MSKLSQKNKFKIGLMFMVLICILAPFIYDLRLPNEDKLISVYDRQLEPIHIDNIMGIEMEKKRIIKGKNYSIQYRIIEGDKFDIIEMLGKRFRENNWKYIERKKIRNDSLFYSMEKDDYLVRIHADNNILRINIEVKGLYRK